MTRSDPMPPCRVALDGLTSMQRSELLALLHRRLRLVTLLALAPFGLFLARNLLDPSHFETTGMMLHILVTAILAGLAVLLWRKTEWTECQLRRAELALLAATAGFFCWQQLALYRNPCVFQAAETATDLEVVRMWINASALRWFFLIVVYGVFIPASWPRCAAVAGFLMALPIALTLIGALAADKVRDDVLYGMSDLVILLGTGVAVAVFGSWRMQALREEALQAQQLGQYRLKRLIGKGGMGEVHEAEHLLLRRTCAVKLIRPGPMRDAEALERFEREVRAMATLTHPNSVDVYDYGRADDGTLYYVMEYLPGLTLDELVARHGPVPPGRAIRFLRQLCRALREAHGIGLLHRDIKPSNVIACERGGEHDVAKLLDYGLVQGHALGEEAKRLTLRGMVLGSPPFMPPEQAAGRTDIDARADLYSLGGVGYFLLTGQPPFQRETAMEMMLAHAYEDAVPPSRLRADVPRGEGVEQVRHHRHQQQRLRRQQLTALARGGHGNGHRPGGSRARTGDPHAQADEQRRDGVAGQHFLRPQFAHDSREREQGAVPTEQLRVPGDLVEVDGLVRRRQVAQEFGHDLESVAQCDAEEREQPGHRYEAQALPPAAEVRGERQQW